MNGVSPKVYVKVGVIFDEDGAMRPRCLEWEDGRTYKIDRVKAVTPAHAMKAGGQGDRYTIIVGGQERYLFFEHSSDFGSKNVGRWFLERKDEMNQ